MNNIKVCYTCDNNYAQYTGVSIASVLKNAKDDDNIHFYIINNDITDDNKEKINNLKRIKDCEITFVNFDEKIFDVFKSVKTTDYLSIASFFRLRLSSLIPNEDKIIYLDPDIVVNTSLAELFNTDITNYFCGGILDIGHKRHAKRCKIKDGKMYVNSGVLLVNLKKQREENAEEKFIKTAQECNVEIRLGDQDIINLSFEGKIYKLNSKWNVQVINYCSCSDYSGEYNIIHYTGSSKPWKFGSYIPAKKEYFKYLNLTDWDKPDNDWLKKSHRVGMWQYFKHRPIFFLRPGFYKYLKGYVFNKYS